MSILKTVTFAENGEFAQVTRWSWPMHEQMRQKTYRKLSMSSLARLISLWRQQIVRGEPASSGIPGILDFSWLR